MGMTPEDFYTTFVLENFSDFKGQEHSVRLGFNACVSASHLADHFYCYYTANLPGQLPYSDFGNYIAELTNKCGEFADIRSIANAYKHLYHTRGNIIVDSAGAIALAEIEEDDVSNLKLDYQKPQKPQVMYQKRSGERVKLLDSLQSVIDLWEGEIFPYA